MVVDVQSLNVDFLVASSHKVGLLTCFCTVSIRNSNNLLNMCFRCVGPRELDSYMVE